MSNFVVSLGDIHYSGSTLDFVLKLHGLGKGEIIKKLTNKSKDEIINFAYRWIKNNPVYFDRKRDIKTGPLLPIFTSSNMARIPIILFEGQNIYKADDEPIAFINLHLKDYNLCSIKYNKYHKEMQELGVNIFQKKSSGCENFFSTDNLIRSMLVNYLTVYLNALRVDDNTYLVEDNTQGLLELKKTIEDISTLSKKEGLPVPILDISINKLESLGDDEKKLPAAIYILNKINSVRAILSKTRIDEINKFYINRMNLMLASINELISQYKPDMLEVQSEFHSLLNDYSNIINWSNEM